MYDFVYSSDFGFFLVMICYLNLFPIKTLYQRVQHINKKIYTQSSCLSGCPPPSLLSPPATHTHAHTHIFPLSYPLSHNLFFVSPKNPPAHQEEQKQSPSIQTTHDEERNISNHAASEDVLRSDHVCIELCKSQE